uniref:Uncharacterized protein n=1 Tax=Rhizophora mucronata TaxID=61149 RepID=A0A2P2IJ03_RHIMU
MSMAAKISFMRLTLLSVLCSPSLVSFLILLITTVCIGTIRTSNSDPRSEATPNCW